VWFGLEFAHIKERPCPFADADLLRTEVASSFVWPGMRFVLGVLKEKGSQSCAFKLRLRQLRWWSLGCWAMTRLPKLAVACKSPPPKLPRRCRSSQVIGMQVWDPRNQQLGTIQDVVIDYGGSCPVAFFAVAPGISGIAEGYVVVPFDVIRLRYDNRSRRDYVVLDVSLDQFRNAPRLEGNNWDRIRDQQFLGRTRQFYQRVERSAARPISPGEAEKASPRDAVRPETRAPVDAGRRPNGYRRSDTERSPDKGTRSDTEEKSDKSSASAPRKNVGPSMERGGTGDNGKQEDSGSHDGRRQFNPR
jgi:sporulation protein YlmC with PRC-barrel domain